MSVNIYRQFESGGEGVGGGGGRTQNYHMLGNSIVKDS